MAPPRLLSGMLSVSGCKCSEWKRLDSSFWLSSVFPCLIVGFRCCIATSNALLGPLKPGWAYGSASLVFWGYVFLFLALPKLCCADGSFLVRLPPACSVYHCSCSTERRPRGLLILWVAWASIGKLRMMLRMATGME